MTKGQFKKILEIRKRTGIKYIPGKDNPQGFIGRYNNNPVKQYYNGNCYHVLKKFGYYNSYGFLDNEGN